MASGTAQRIAPLVGRNGVEHELKMAALHALGSMTVEARPVAVPPGAAPRSCDGGSRPASCLKRGPLTKSLILRQHVSGSAPSVTVPLSTAPVTTGASLPPVIVMVSVAVEVAPWLSDRV